MLSNLVRTPHFLAVLVLTFGAFSLGMAEFTTIWLLPEITTELNTSIGKTGNTASYYALGVIIGTPILAIFGTTIPRQKLFTYLLLWCMVGNMATSFVTSWEQLKWVRFFCGMPHGVYLGMASIILTHSLPAQHHGKAIGVLMAGIGMALLLIVPLTTFIGEMQNWRIIFRFVALIDLLIILLLHDLLPTLPQPPSKRGFGEIQVLKNPLVWWVLAISATAICGRMAIFAYAEPIVLHITHLPRHKLPLIVMCGGIGTVVGFLLGGYFADKNLHKTLLYSLVWFVVVIVLFNVFSHHDYLIYLGFFILGTFMLIVPALQVMSIRYAPEGETFASCLNHAAMNVANAMGPLLASLLIGAGYGWLSSTWVGIGVGLIALFVFMLGMVFLVPKAKPIQPNLSAPPQ